MTNLVFKGLTVITPSRIQMWLDRSVDGWPQSELFAPRSRMVHHFGPGHALPIGQEFLTVERWLK